MPASSHFQQENVLSSTFFPILFNLYFLAQFSYTLIDFFSIILPSTGHPD